jgi:lipase maturation factor 1
LIDDLSIAGSLAAGASGLPGIADGTARAIDAQGTDYRLSAWLFLRLLAVVYLAAFTSLWVQIDGLVGSKGIAPAEAFLHEAKLQYGGASYYLLPTLCWFGAGDGILHFLCGSGVLLAILLLIGILPGPACLGLWALYLSLSVIGQEFLGYQWDTLLTETGLLAVFLAPWKPRPRLLTGTCPSRIVIWLFHWLLFRLIFMSGLVKLLSGDPTWRHLTALQFHYQTQPIPTWTSWYMHQLPAWFQGVSVVFTFVLELVLPICIFGPRQCRMLAFIGLSLLQLLITATGNYGFFNLLTMALCVLLLDNRCFPRRWRPVSVTVRSTLASRLRQALALGFAIVAVAFTAMPMLRLISPNSLWPQWLVTTRAVVSSLRSFNSYGLFAVMTTDRREIIMEGSDDGKTWLPYQFKWKPGDLARAPSFTGLHMPRLDWQMWFAALSDQAEPWFENFMARLLQGSPPVLSLLEHNPFADKPPRYIRASAYQYHFTTPDERRTTGAWWRREYQGPYSMPMSLPGASP